MFRDDFFRRDVKLGTAPLELLREFGEQAGFSLGGRFQHIEATDVAHIDEFAEQLVRECGEEPPDPSLIFRKKREQLLAVELDPIAVALSRLEPNLYILAPNRPLARIERETAHALPSDQDIPVCRDFRGHMTLKITVLEEHFDAALGCQDELIFFAVKAEFKGLILKGLAQNIAALLNQLITAHMLCVLVHDAAEFRFLRRKTLPDAFRSLAQIFGKARQRDAALAVVDEILCILIAGECCKCLTEVV